MDGATWLAALGLALILEGLLPFVAPRAWRQAFSQLMQMRDGQVRFFGLLALLGGLALLNLATFTAYAMDKRAAAQGQWRTPENTLHALAVAGGWPAAWLAQRTLRHKSRKTSFLAAYVATVLLNLGALAALWRHGG